MGWSVSLSSSCGQSPSSGTGSGLLTHLHPGWPPLPPCPDGWETWWAAKEREILTTWLKTLVNLGGFLRFPFTLSESRSFTPVLLMLTPALTFWFSFAEGLLSLGQVQERPKTRSAGLTCDPWETRFFSLQQRPALWCPTQHVGLPYSNKSPMISPSGVSRNDWGQSMVSHEGSSDISTSPSGNANAISSVWGVREITLP